MPDRSDILAAVLEIEWDMFSNVNNAGGKASCQSQHEEFLIMRKSQFARWSDEALASWLDDLKQARSERRNLMSEKYARMMEKTFPKEYAQIAEHLPPVPEESLAKIAEIVAVHVAWKEELNAKYPVIGSLGRPARAKDDSMGLPSLETYMTAELKSYSPRTLDLVYKATMESRDKGQNEALATLEAQVQLSGFPSLDEAEAFQRQATGR